MALLFNSFSYKTKKEPSQVVNRLSPPLALLPFLLPVLHRVVCVWLSIDSFLFCCSDMSALPLVLLYLLLFPSLSPASSRYFGNGHHDHRVFRGRRPFPILNSVVAAPLSGLLDGVVARRVRVVVHPAVHVGGRGVVGGGGHGVGLLLERGRVDQAALHIDETHGWLGGARSGGAVRRVWCGGGGSKD